MTEKPIPVTFTGDDCIELKNCFVFRDNLAHKANVAISSAISYADDPHLFQISTSVPGSKKLSLRVGIPFPEMMKLIRHAVLWHEYIQEYDSYKLDVVSTIFRRHIADLTAFPWSDNDRNAVREMDVHNEMQEEVKADLLSIAEASLEGEGNE